MKETTAFKFSNTIPFPVMTLTFEFTLQPITIALLHNESIVGGVPEMPFPLSRVKSWEHNGSFNWTWEQGYIKLFGIRVTDLRITNEQEVYETQLHKFNFIPKKPIPSLDFSNIATNPKSSDKKGWNL